MTATDHNDRRHSRDRDVPAQARPRRGDKPARHNIPTDQTRAWSAEQIAQRQPQGLARTAEVREVDEDNRTVELSFSSETPVRRFFGDEVLSHADGAMRTGRLDASAPLLMNHDWDDQIGVVESHEIRDRKGRVTVRFSRSARGEEMWQDVVDGIRRNVSVGYSIHGVQVQEREGQPDLVTVTDWEPLEISLAPVAADVSVGVGRSHQPENPPEAGAEGGAETGNRDQSHDRTNTHEGRSAMKTKTLRRDNGDLVRAKVNEDGEIVEVLEVIEEAGEGERTAQRQGAEAEQARTRELLEMGAAYDARDLAQTAVAEGTTVDAFQRQLLGHLYGDTNEASGESGARSGFHREPNRHSPALGDQGASIGMSEQETRRYSFVRAIRAQAFPNDRRIQQEAAFEMECSDEASRKLGRSVRGFMVPEDVLSRAINTSTSGSAAGDTGGNVVDDVLMTGSFIDLLRAKTVAMRVARTMTGLTGDLSIPRKTSGGQTGWIGEGQEVKETAFELGLIKMSPKTVGAFIDVTRQQIMQSSMDMEMMMRDELATDMALEIDRTFFYGNGTDHEPLGVFNTDGLNAVTLADSGRPDYSELVSMETQIALDNADVNSMVYVMPTSVRGHLKQTEKFPGTSGAPIFENGGTVNGYRSEVTNQIKQGDIIFGNWADALIGMWGGLELRASEEQLFRSGGLEVRAMQSVDFALRRSESFCIGRADGSAG